MAWRQLHLARNVRPHVVRIERKGVNAVSAVEAGQIAEGLIPVGHVDQALERAACDGITLYVEGGEAEKNGRGLSVLSDAPREREKKA